MHANFICNYSIAHICVMMRGNNSYLLLTIIQKKIITYLMFGIDLFVHLSENLISFCHLQKLFKFFAAESWYLRICRFLQIWLTKLYYIDIRIYSTNQIQKKCKFCTRIEMFSRSEDGRRDIAPDKRSTCIAQVSSLNNNLYKYFKIIFEEVGRHLFFFNLHRLRACANN